MEETVCNWNVKLSDIDVPDYFTSFSALAVVVLNLSLPHKLANEVTGILASLLLETDEQRKFVIDSLQPVIRDPFNQMGSKQTFWTRFFCSLVSSAQWQR